MNIIATSLPEVKIIQLEIWPDARGFFLETFQKERYQTALAIPDLDFVQDNCSHSKQGVLRGLHFQRNYPQGKLVSVMHGEIFDVAVDIRPQSPTFGQWTGNILSSSNQKQCWIPPGFAHGFLVLSETALCLYKCTDYYHPQDEACLRWDDPSVHIDWPQTNPILSEKDQRGKTLHELFPSTQTDKTTP